MSVELLRPPSRPPTGGPALARVHRKRWWRELTRRVRQVLDTVIDEDVLTRRPAVSVDGADVEAWTSWFARYGAVAKNDRLSLALTVDATADLAVPRARALLGERHRSLAPGGRLVVVERVVRRPGQQTRGVRDLLTVLIDATGGAVTLADVASLTRSGETHRSTVLLELVRLRLPEDS